MYNHDWIHARTRIHYLAFPTQQKVDQSLLFLALEILENRQQVDLDLVEPMLA